jgi:hypothetical protein
MRMLNKLLSLISGLKKGCCQCDSSQETGKCGDNKDKKKKGDKKDGAAKDIYPMW